MGDDRRRIAGSLSKAVQALPPAERQGFRAFLASLPGAEPRRRKTHSWKRKRKVAPVVKVSARDRFGRRTSRQFELPFGGTSGAPSGAPIKP
jgi:hypothetical protein